MSISRENWSALSTLAQQWVMGDEEEVERERRRKTKSFISDADREIFSDEYEPQNTSESSAPEDGDSGCKGLEQLQIDFVEMLRMRDEHRRRRHVETLSRQRQEEKVAGEVRQEEEAQVEVLGDTEDDNMKHCMDISSPPVSSVDFTHNPTSARDKQVLLLDQKGNRNTDYDSTAPTSTEPLQKFVSSVSISFDKSATKTKVKSPLRSTSYQENQNGSACSFEPTDKLAFTRQSSRTMSFRMLKKKEEESMPLQRSASMRMAVKKSDPNQSSNEEEEQQSPFQRNCRQRLSSHSIQEKMERLAQASQKWEATKSPTLDHKTLFLVDEVSKKRGLFEKDQAATKSSPASCSQDYHALSAGITDRINRWVQKKTFQSLSSLTPTDLRHVDISSRKMMFERGQEDGHPNVHK